MINKNNIRLSETDPKLFSVEDTNTGLLIFYIGEGKELFTGELYEEFNGQIVSEYEVKNGKKEGIQKDYFQSGELEEISEWRGNLKYGISKVYEEQGRLESVSTVWNNDYIKIIEVLEKKVFEKKIIKKENLPKKIIFLLSLSDQELLDYSFNEKNEFYSEQDNNNFNGWEVVDNKYTIRDI